MTTDPAPLLRPGLKPGHPGPYYAAWKHLWALTRQGPIPWADARAEMVTTYGIATKSADNIIRDAIKHGHLAKAGAYVQTGPDATDTRTIERKDPQR